nr:hypothetical protein [Streptomyces sp. LBUM 1482]
MATGLPETSARHVNVMTSPRSLSQVVWKTTWSPGTTTRTNLALTDPIRVISSSVSGEVDN